MVIIGSRFRSEISRAIQPTLPGLATGPVNAFQFTEVSPGPNLLG
jgi:hypothetical protein